MTQIHKTQIHEDPIRTFEPLAVMVAAWDGDRVRPGSKHYFGVTITNRGDQDAVVQVRIESISPLLSQWCQQPEQWIALTRTGELKSGETKSGELTFCIDVPTDALPQWLDYEVIVLPQAGYGNTYLPTQRCRLQILAPELTITTTDPTFTLIPETTPDRPHIIQPGNPIPVELILNNRSERVDRFRLDCTGLPDDWMVAIDYAQDFGGLGLINQADSLGLNPGDRGLIKVLIYPPTIPLAGNYLPTFRLTSENIPNLGLLGLVYLQVNPIYQIQAQLKAVQDIVRDRHPAQFNLQFANLGNTDRRLQFKLTPKTPPNQCRYIITDSPINIEPQTTAIIPFTAQPQPWWRRSWIGRGNIYPFQVDFVDPDGNPEVPASIEGYLTWKARPWWHLLLVTLAGLGLLGALAFLIWWHFFRPPSPPKILEFAAEDSRYTAKNQDMARVRWQIANPDRIQTLKLTGYSSEGSVLSGPLIYEFKNGQLPMALQPFCTLEKAVLNCSQIRSDAFQPGKYIFELTLLPQGKDAVPLSVKTNSVEITAKPLPMVITIASQSLIYREDSPGQPSDVEKGWPIADAGGVKLDWAVTMPQDITALHLIGRSVDGKMVGDRWFEISQSGQLPEELRAFCQIGVNLICRNVPTGLTAVGEYRLELVPIAQRGISAPQTDNVEGKELKPKTTEIIKIQPKMPQILNFQINGQEAPPKLLIPITPEQPSQVLQLSWRVQGGKMTQVELMPSPGNVPLIGQVNFPLTPGTTTLTLQVKSPTGELIKRSVTIELFNPNSADAVGQAIAAMKANPSNLSGNGSKSSGAQGFSNPGSNPTDPAKSGGNTGESRNDRLSPAEQPPQF